MAWIWQHKEWPEFRFNARKMVNFEQKFLHKAGMLYGAMLHIDEDDTQTLAIQLMSEEAYKTSEIEGEVLNRDSLQSSIQRHLGLKNPRQKTSPAEEGISEMMVDAYNTYDASLDHETLFRWHSMLTNGRRDLQDIGCYRTHNEPMQIISNSLHEIKVHYEAPPSKIIQKEMNKFLSWFNKKSREEKISPLARAGIAHLYFEAIHPFEDGNGRIGRAVSEKSLSQDLNRPALVALSKTIEKHRKDYYSALQRNSSGDLDITDWLLFFAEIVLEGQDTVQGMIDFLIGKTKYYDRFTSQLNERQEKVIARLFKEGPEGFKGGMSADNYIRITGAPRATATRDLQDLTAKGALVKTGALRYTRYHLNLK